MAKMKVYDRAKGAAEAAKNQAEAAARKVAEAINQTEAARSEVEGMLAEIPEKKDAASSERTAAVKEVENVRSDLLDKLNKLREEISSEMKSVNVKADEAVKRIEEAHKAYDNFVSTLEGKVDSINGIIGVLWHVKAAVDDSVAKCNIAIERVGESLAAMNGSPAIEAPPMTQAEVLAEIEAGRT